jgi:diacylglycerol kinase (ATP)
VTCDNAALVRFKLIYNPAGGRGRVSRHIADVERYLTAAGATIIDSQPSKSPEHLTQLAADSSRDKTYDRVAICGGDGTLHYATRAFDLSGGTMALIPLGSGDDFARVLGIPRSLPQACATAVRGRVREVDVALANNLRYLGVAGFGFDSEVARFANEHVRFLKGSLVYLYSIVRVLPRFKPHRVKMFASEIVRDEEIMFAAVGNSRQYGGGIRITPSAVVDDGVLDVCIVHRTSRFQLLMTLPRAYNGSHVKKPFVETARGTEFRFESERPLDVFADGEYLTQTPVRFAMCPQKLKIAVPRM